MVPRCGVQERREAPPCQTQKSKRMSIPPALPKPQLMTRDASEGIEPQTQATPKSPTPTTRPEFHLQLLCTLCGSLLVFLVFGEDEANRQNRLDIRSGIPGAGIALNRPMPWNDPGYNMQQPTGDQVLKPAMVRPLVKARAMQRQKSGGTVFSHNHSMTRKFLESSPSNSEPKTTSISKTTTPSNSSKHE